MFVQKGREYRSMKSILEVKIFEKGKKKIRMKGAQVGSGAG